ncbi:uronyl 2-sulfotransferase-like [Styela clava]
MIPKFRWILWVLIFLVACLKFVDYWKLDENETIGLSWRPKRQTLSREYPLPNLRNRNVFYNRIEKCGSRSLISIAINIAQRNKIKVISDNKIYKRKLEGVELKELQQNIINIFPPTFYERHLLYVDFDMYPESLRPVYINIVRDPIERFVSHFNYEKYGDASRNKSRSPPKAGRENINDCVLKEIGVCNRHNPMMFNMGFYFCGMGNTCKIRSATRVKIAKRHVDEKYSVIGVLEEFEKTLLLFEWMLPDYFQGALDIWKTHNETSGTTESIKRDFLTPESRKKLKEDLMADEYEVYYHAKRKFENLKRKYLIT